MNDPFTEPNPAPQTQGVKPTKSKCCRWKIVSIIAIIIALLGIGTSVYFYIQSLDATPETSTPDGDNDQSTGTPDEHTLAGQLKTAYCLWEDCSDPERTPSFDDDRFQPQASSNKPWQYLIYGEDYTYWFFRPSPSAEWQYFRFVADTIAGIVDCREFMFAPLHLAFATVPCTDFILDTESGPTETTVQDYSYTYIDPRN